MAGTDPRTKHRRPPHSPPHKPTRKTPPTQPHPHNNPNQPHQPAQRPRPHTPARSPPKVTSSIHACCSPPIPPSARTPCRSDRATPPRAPAGCRPSSLEFGVVHLRDPPPSRSASLPNGRPAGLQPCHPPPLPPALRPNPYPPPQRHHRLVSPPAPPQGPAPPPLPTQQPPHRRPPPPTLPPSSPPPAPPPTPHNTYLPHPPAPTPAPTPPPPHPAHPTPKNRPPSHTHTHCFKKARNRLSYAAAYARSNNERSAIGFTKPEERHQCHARRRHDKECWRYFVAGAFHEPGCHQR